MMPIIIRESPNEASSSMEGRSFLGSSASFLPHSFPAHGRAGDSEARNKTVLMKWGLIPFWAKNPNIGYKMINARAENLHQKPSFRKPLYSQRCLVPTSGFYEWQKLEDGKIPYHIRLKNNKMFTFAGLLMNGKTQKAIL